MFSRPRAVLLLDLRTDAPPCDAHLLHAVYALTENLARMSHRNGAALASTTLFTALFARFFQGDAASDAAAVRPMIHNILGHSARQRRAPRQRVLRAPARRPRRLPRRAGGRYERAGCRPFRARIWAVASPPNVVSLRRFRYEAQLSRCSSKALHHEPALARQLEFAIPFLMLDET